MIKRKRGFAIVPNTLVYWILGILVLVGFFVLVSILYNKDMSVLEFLKNIFRFGR